MNEFNEREETGALKQSIKVFVTLIFVVFGPGLSRSTGSVIGFWLFYFFWFLVYMFIMGMLNKKKDARFDFKMLLKQGGIVILAFLILYNVVRTFLSLSPILPQSVTQSLPPIIYIVLLIFSGVGIYLVEKNSKS